MGIGSANANCQKQRKVRKKDGKDGSPGGREDEGERGGVAAPAPAYPFEARRPVAGRPGISQGKKKPGRGARADGEDVVGGLEAYVEGLAGVWRAEMKAWAMGWREGRALGEILRQGWVFGAF